MSQFQVGYQLYSVRDEMQADMAGTLKQISSMGYTHVEFAGFFDHSAKEVRKMLDENHLSGFSVHQGYLPLLEKPEETIQYLQTVGVKYYIIPYLPEERHRTEDGFQKTILLLQAAVKLLEGSGISLMYHNHDFEFKALGNDLKIDRLLDAVPQMGPEFDTCWIKYAGYSPEEYLMKYRGRIEVAHLKDFVGQIRPEATQQENGFEYRPIGQGVQDIPSIVKAAEEAGVQYLVVEQDASVTCPPLAAAKLSRDYLKSIGI